MTLCSLCPGCQGGNGKTTVGTFRQSAIKQKIGGVSTDDTRDYRNG